MSTLPTGCPETMMWNRSELDRTMAAHRGVHYWFSGCPAMGCTPVEIHPQGTGERMAKMEKALKYYASDLAEFSFHDKDGFLCDANTFSGKAKDALQSLTPGATDANHD